MFAHLALQYVSMSSSQNRLPEPVLLNLPWNLRKKKTTELMKQTAALVCSLDHRVCATVEKLAFVAWGELVKVAMKLYLHIFSKIWF